MRLFILAAAAAAAAATLLLLQVSALLILAAAAVAALLLLQVSAARTVRTEPLLRYWNPIKNLGDPFVREIAQFAVKARNDQAQTGLVLEKVLKAEILFEAGINYRIVFEVKDGTNTRRFEALVWDKPWEHSRHLSSFNAV
ncbi:cysteine proteinase inhibitor 1-like [Eucalyptus grandis]|uniref:cysteine proteinase inhibitor 1-like n=1 Tax=Eucalyptus grandis TaxID=71139 RepID=UPI00192EDE1D|nr:cysteine proteinase inhibitor 1-like [Eucalyptus grandis]